METFSDMPFEGVSSPLFADDDDSSWEEDVSEILESIMDPLGDILDPDDDDDEDDDDS